MFETFISSGDAKMKFNKKDYDPELRNSNRAKQAKEKLNEEYSQSPLDQYVSGIGISSLKAMKSLGRMIFLREYESLESLCLVVRLKKEPPQDLRLYGLYDIYRVFYEKELNYKPRARPAFPDKGE